MVVVPVGTAVLEPFELSADGCAGEGFAEGRSILTTTREEGIGFPGGETGIDTSALLLGCDCGF